MTNSASHDGARRARGRAASATCRGLRGQRGDATRVVRVVRRRARGGRTSAVAVVRARAHLKLISLNLTRRSLSALLYRVRLLCDLNRRPFVPL